MVDLSKFDSAAAAIARVIEKFDGQGIFIGGFAVSLVARPRFTEDIDAMILQRDRTVGEFLAAFAAEGIRPRNDDPESFAALYRMLLLVHEDSQIPVDVSLGMLSFEERAVERSFLFRSGGIGLRLASAEDLVVMKLVAGRPQDVGDVASLLNSHPELDRAFVHRTVEEFASVLENDEMVELARRLVPLERGL